MKVLSILLSLLLVCSPVFGGVLFDDVDDMLNINSAVVSGTPITMCAVFNTTDAAASQTILAINDADVDSEWFRLLLHSTGFVGAGTNSDGGTGFQRAYSTTSFSANTNHSACAVFTDENNRHAYLDGAGKGSDTGSDSTPDGLDRTVIGLLTLATPTEPFDGTIYHVEIWGSALTDAEILDWHNAKMKTISCQTDTSNLIDSWWLDDVPDGTSADGDTFISRCGSGGNDMTGDDGANNTGLTAVAEQVLSYP